MLTNLFTSLVIAFGVGVSSVNMDHNINSKADNITQYEEITNYSDCVNYYNSIDKIYLKDIDFSNPYIVYKLPSYLDFFSSQTSVEGALCNISDGTRSLGLVFNDSGEHSYTLSFIGPFGSKDIYSLSDYYDYYYYGTLDELNINFSDWYIVKENNSFNHAIGFVIFYFSQYSFSGSVYDISTSKPVVLFSSALLNNYFGFSSIHGEKIVYKGWFKCNGVYYNEIKMTCIDAQGTKYYEGQALNSSQLKQINSSPNYYIYVMNVQFINTINNSSIYAYTTRSYAIDDTLSNYLDISYNGWNVREVEFINISCVGSPQVRNDLVNLGYYKTITHLNDLISSSSNNNSWLNNSFSLINSALFGLGGLFSIQILPFVNLGTLIFLPLLFVIVLFVVKLFKR